jgi:CheY-like chemotaxis protein
MRQKPLRILLVEDNPADVMLTRMTIEETGLPHQLMTVADGESALNYLDVASPQPDLMMLDLSLPVLDGFGVLERLQRRANGRDIPVVVLSSSDADVDRQRTLELGARLYFVKPSTLSGYRDLAQELQMVWKELPSTSGGAVS